MPGCRQLGRAGAALLLASVVAADEQRFDGRTEVVLVEVPVVVATAGGEPLRGLARDDFTVFADGRRQQLAGFQVVDLAQLEPDPSTPRLADVPAAARRHVLLLFDLVFSSPLAILRAQEAARRLVTEELATSDLAAVVALTLEDGPRVLAAFSADRAQLARAIDTLAASPTPSSEPDPRESSDLERGRIDAWLRGLETIAARLAELPAPKQVLTFSAGFEPRLLFGRADTPDDLELHRERRALEHGEIWRSSAEERFGNSELRKELDEVLDAFRRGACTLHAVDVGGSGQDRPGRDVLHRLASSTGGALITGRGDLAEPLARALGGSRLTYLLSFYPDRAGRPGAAHRLEVRIRNLPRGARIVHKPSYSDPDPAAALHPFERELVDPVSAGTAPRQELDVALLAVPFATGGTRAYLAVIVELAGDELLSAASGATLPIELYAYATDTEGSLRASFTEKLDLDLGKTRDQLAEGLSYYGHLELEPGDYTLRVLARAGAGGRTGARSLELRVPAADEPWLSPPLFPATGQPLRLREKTAPNDRGAVPYPFLDRDRPFIPSARAEIRSGERVAFFLLGQNLPAGDPQASLERGEEKQALELTLIERRSADLETMVLSLAGQDLGKGAGILKVRLSDLESAVEIKPALP